MKKLPIVAIIGRPNVGKSTLLNRLTGSRNAIVHDEAGITRDRLYQPSFWRDRDFLVVDTGGLIFDDESEFLPEIRQQAMLALSEAVAAIFVVDGQTGPTVGDHEIADWLREQAVPVFLAVNKCESPEQGLIQAAQFWELGLGEPYPVSGIHGSGTGDLLDEIIPYFPAPEALPELDENTINVSIVGRPNVGKSSLLNALTGMSRSIVSSVSGTTRDAIDLEIEYQSQPYRLIDTAGVRKKKHVRYGTEFFSINRAFKAIQRSDVVLLVIDALEGITDQDLKLAGRIEDEGKAAIIVVNKWDALEKDSHTIYRYERQLRDRVYFMDWCEITFVSALSGKRVKNIFQLIQNAVSQHRRRVSTAVINEVIQEAVAWYSPPTNRQGKQGRIYYGTQVKTQPPTIALFVNDPKRFNDTYRRYIERQFREQLGFQGTPIRLLWRGKRERDVEASHLNQATQVGEKK